MDMGSSKRSVTLTRSNFNSPAQFRGISIHNKLTEGEFPSPKGSNKHMYGIPFTSSVKGDSQNQGDTVSNSQAFPDDFPADVQGPHQSLTRELVRVSLETQRPASIRTFWAVCASSPLNHQLHQ